jgi:putative addiction module component (TIGR02574 family)
MSVELAEILSLPIPERIKLVEDIWDSIAAESGAVQLSTEQRTELDRRIENYKKDPSGTIPWETIKSEALARK